MVRIDKKGLAIFAVGLTIRLLYLINSALKDPLFYHPIMDPLYHHQWALAIIRGGWLNQLPYFRAPLYPHLLALSYLIFGVNLLIPRIIQALLAAFSSYLVYRISCKLFSERIGFYSGFITALYPTLIYFDGELLIPSLLVFLTLLGFYLLINERLLLAGLTFGLAAVTRPNILAFVSVLILYYIIKKRSFWPIIIGIVISIFPVTLRNYLVSKEIIVIAWQGGVNFYIGNNSSSDGMTAIIPGTRKDWWGGYYDARRIVREAIGHEPSYHEIDRFWFRRGLEYIIKNPLNTVGLYLKKMYLLISGFEVANNRSIYFFKDFTFLRYLIIFTPIFQFPFGLLFPFAVVGIYVWAKKKKDPLLLIFILSYSASFLPFFINARFRVPLLPFLTPYAVLGFFSIKRTVKDLIIFIPAFALSNSNLMMLPVTNSAQDHLTLAGFYLKQGDLERAIQEATKSLRYAELAETRNLLGRISMEIGEAGLAIREYQSAIRLDPKLPEPYLNIGNYYARTGRIDSAFSYILTAIRIDPYNARSWNSLGNLYFTTGSLKEAEEAYLKSSRLEPGYISPLYHLALLYLKTDRREKVIALYHKIAKTDPDSKFLLILKRRLNL